MKRIALLLTIFLFSTILVFAQTETAGSLKGFSSAGAELGLCPLKHTDVKTEISGFLARVRVTQEFENNYGQAIEAVYTFPLSQNSAVDDMTLRIGDRVIRGEIMEREEARKVYEQARSQGKTTALLNQERPNIFTQSVANIRPGERILIEISYVESLKFEAGEYEFVFPMTIGPRYIPGSVKPDDAARISPPISGRPAHDISIEVMLDAGVPIETIRSTLHEVDTVSISPNSAKITLRDQNTIPNKDFILRYDVTGKRIEDALLTHRDQRGGFFALILSPPENFAAEDMVPKEIVFVLDTSGSMSGFPIEKAKEAMRLTLEGLNPNDTFNLITFAGDTHILFPEPVAASPENLVQARQFLSNRSGGGGTEMMKAITAALKPSNSQKHLRIVCFMTDGYVGNESQIIGEIQRYPNSRVFSFGIGNSVNRFLLDRMAQEGRGEVEYVSLNDDGEKAARRFYDRIRAPLLTDIAIEWNGLSVRDVYPARNPDLFSAKPVVIYGRFEKAESGTIKLKGMAGGQHYQRLIDVNFPESEPSHDVLATLWARKMVDQLTMKNLNVESKDKEITKKSIIDLGIQYRLMTEYTSFVAVEESDIISDGQPMRVRVPVQPANVVTGGSNPHGFVLSGSFKGKGDRGNRNIKENKFADVVDLQLSTTINGRTVILGEPEKPDSAAAAGNNNEPGGTGNIVSEIFRRIDKHQKSLTSLRADLEMSKYDSTLEESETSQGSAVYLPIKGRNALIRIDWAKPVEEIFTAVNGNFMLYRPRLKQAISGSMDKIPESFILLDPSEEKLKSNYDITYLGNEKLGNDIPVWHLKLTPKADSQFKSIEIWVDGNGMPWQVKIIEKNNDHSIIRLSNLQKNTVIESSVFELKLPKDTKIIKE